MKQRTLGRLTSTLVVVALVISLLAYVARPQTARAAASLSVTPTSGPPTMSVTVAGTGFSAGESINLSLDSGATFFTVPATQNTSGNWTAAVSFPAAPSGPHNLAATGGTSGTTATASFTVTPAMRLTSSSGVAGSSVTVNGVGFVGGETVTLTYDGATVASGIIADSLGSWSKAFVVPASPAGSHTVGASGSTTPAASVPVLTFITTAGISVNPTSGSPGSSVTVTGSGFAAGETGVTVTYDGASVASGITANGQGGWSKAFVVPASPSGSHTIGAGGSATSAAIIAGLVFTTTAGVSVNPTSGAPGSSITVTGSGFGPGETGIIVTYDGNQIASGVSANGQGGWTKTVIVPASSAGSHAIGAGGSSTLATTVQGATFNSTAGISVSPSGGSAGSSVTVDGSGFGPNETGITVTFDGKIVASGIKANAQGTWKGTFTVPASTGGPHGVDAYGAVTGAATVSEATFNIGAGLSVTPAVGNIGGTIDISGTGFAPNSSLTFFYDNGAIPIDEAAKTDGTGSFTQSVTVPKSKHGPHTIRVADQQSDSSTVTFTVSSVPPAVPRPLSPADGAAAGLLGNARPTFKWSNVIDPNGVGYVLQIDTTTAFSQPILEKAGIPGNQYTLAASEALSSGEYYWRVKAVDGASNESAWSDPQLLKSGAMPAWVFVLIIVAVVAAVGGVAVFLLTRAARRRREAAAVGEVEISRVFPARIALPEPEQSSRPAQRRLALPQPTRRGKTIPAEDMARLKVVIDFAQSLPLVEPGYTADWVIDLIQSGAGGDLPGPIHEQLLKGEIRVRYEPTWMRHPTYQDLESLLQGQPVLRDLDTFVDFANRCASEAVSLLKNIYGDATAEIRTDFLTRGGWGFVAAIYADAQSWFLGRSLRDPSQRDYVIKRGQAVGQEAEALWLWGEDGTAFAQPLIQVLDEKDASQAQALHLRLRVAYRSDERARQLVGMMTQLGVQRNRLVDAFGQFSSFTQ